MEWATSSEIDPAISSVMISSMDSWRNNTLYEVLEPQQRHLNDAVVAQTEIGWHQLFNGFLSSQWVIQQEHYLEITRSKKSAILCLVRFQRRIWEIAWLMWEDRNNKLHVEDSSVHLTDRRNINRFIRQEWDLSLNGLPHLRYNYLFQGRLRQRIRDKIESKKLWLTSVWSARDSYARLMNQDPPHREEAAKELLSQWKKKRKRSNT